MGVSFVGGAPFWESYTGEPRRKSHCFAGLGKGWSGNPLKIEALRLEVFARSAVGSEGGLALLLI